MPPTILSTRVQDSNQNDKLALAALFASHHRSTNVLLFPVVRQRIGTCLLPVGVQKNYLAWTVLGMTWQVEGWPTDAGEDCARKDSWAGVRESAEGGYALDLRGRCSVSGTTTLPFRFTSVQLLVQKTQKFWCTNKAASHIDHRAFCLLVWCLLPANIPTEIGQLFELTDVNLSGNCLSGSYQPKISTLDRTHPCICVHNANDRYKPISIQACIIIHCFHAVWFHFVWFGLVSCGVSGPIPTEIGRLTCLNQFQTDENSLTGGCATAMGWDKHFELFVGCWYSHS